MKDMTIKEIEELKKQAQNLIGEILDKYECLTPMIIEDILLDSDETSGKNVVIFRDSYIGTDTKTYIKNE